MRFVRLQHKFVVMFLSALALLLSGVSVHSQNMAAGASLSQLGTANEELESPDNREFIDGIAAVVNKSVITLRQLNLETNIAKVNLQQQGIPVPDQQSLQKQVLQRMIMQELELQEADKMNIVVGEDDLNYAIHTIADRNGITPDQMHKDITASGISWDAYLKDLSKEVKVDILRQRMVEHTIFISDAEVDAFLKNEGSRMAAVRQPEPPAARQPQQVAPQVDIVVRDSGQFIGLRHILVHVPEGSTSSQADAMRQKAEGLLNQIRSGADFAGVAAAASDDPNALEGGDMGVRPTEGWPDLFLSAIKGLQQGQVSKVFKSGNGFHILQVALLDDPNAVVASHSSVPPPVAQPGLAESSVPMPQGSTLVTQTNARHILIKTSKVVSDEQAEQRLLQLRQRIEHGESFAELAKNHSEDASAPLGGDLGWLTPGETVPAFEQTMDRLEPGQISMPVQSQFGWHLIQVNERRNKDMADEFKRMQARQILFQRRVEPAMEDWLNQLRGEAYVENRIDPSDNRSRRR